MSKSEKRSFEEDESDRTEGDGTRKKRRTLEKDESNVTESILDDIRLEEIESRITVHVIESPESCTHEVAVYPGMSFFFNYDKKKVNF